MLIALHHPRDHDKRHELPRCSPKQQRCDREQAISKEIVKQVVALIAPVSHLPLTVVNRMKRPPPRPSVLKTMNPIIQRIENNQIQNPG